MDDTTMTSETNQADHMATLKASAAVAIEDSEGITAQDMLDFFNDPKGMGANDKLVTEAELDAALAALRWEGKAKLVDGAYHAGMETMCGLMFEAAKAILMPLDGEVEVGPLGFRARTDGWAGEVRVIGDGLLVEVQLGGGPTLRVLAGYSWRAQAFDVEATVNWSAQGSVAPEDAAVFAVAVAEAAARAEAVRDLLQPLASEAREALSLATQRWLEANEAEAAHRLAAALTS